jgi:starch phosphorylase
MVKASMALLTPRFNSARMMQEYVEKIYRPATIAYRNRTAEGGRLAEELAAWQKRLNECWKEMRFGRLTTSKEEDSWCFSVEVYFGELRPQDVQVELYADPDPLLMQSGPENPEKTVMTQQGPLAGAANGFIYSVRVPAKRLAEDYTPRIVPYHEHAFIPLEEAHILWMR